MKLNYKNKSGFTLIELLLYITVVALIIGAISTFLSLIWRSQSKSESASTVESDGSAIAQMITQTIKNSNVINTPVIGASSVSLSMATTTANKNPQIIDLSAGRIRIKEGVDPVIELNSSSTVASNLIFYNLARAGTSDVIRGQFTLGWLNPANLNEYSYSKTFYFTASRR
jgi:type II secretory pathway pseudopilin PulG